MLVQSKPVVDRAIAALTPRALASRFRGLGGPGIFHEVARLSNEIVLGEETDQIAGSIYSHMEFYLLAMKDLGCDTSLISKLLEKVGKYRSYRQAVATVPIPDAPKSFMNNTFFIIESNNVAAIAAAFTIGREALVPDMFIEIIKGIKDIENNNLEKLIIYLERHIELDAGEHGPLAFQMLTELCHNDDTQWSKALDSALHSLTARIDLWDSILCEIGSKSAAKKHNNLSATAIVG